MKHFASQAFLAAFLAASGCSWSLSKGDAGVPAAREINSDIQRSERQTSESHTFSRLSAIERSLNDFIQAEGRIPEKLSELIPKYIAEIPEVELGAAGHKDSGAVRYYPPDIIVDGQINGARLKDSGGWGYVHNSERVIIFVDCIHKTMDGRFWYQARGVY
ncbi:MAG: hypothetical protein HY922_01535 [Elusimicrobia bacterium]|nr:hypothetical protein [Elusimicrobiota bacterium]